MDPDTQQRLLYRNRIISPALQQTVSCQFVSMQCSSLQPRAARTLHRDECPPAAEEQLSPTQGTCLCQSAAQHHAGHLPTSILPSLSQHRNSCGPTAAGSRNQSGFLETLSRQSLILIFVASSGNALGKKRKKEKGRELESVSRHHTALPAPCAGRNGPTQAAPSIIYSYYNRDDILKAIFYNYTEIHFLL